MSEAAPKDAEEEPSAATSTDPLEVIVRAGVVKDVIGQMQSIVDEGVFQIGREGLYVGVVDPANVAMLEIDLEPKAFESVGDGQFPIGLDINRLEDYLKRASKSDPVEFEYLPETRKMEIRHEKREFNMAAIDPDSMRNGPDDMVPDVPVSFSVAVSEFRAAIEDADLVADHVIVEADPDAEEIRVLGNGDTDDVRTVFGNEGLEEAQVPEEVRSIFSTDYLVGDDGMLNPMPKDAILSVKLGDEMPLKAVHELDDGRGSVEIGLAPRIVSD
ncbi:beta clamp domain-containing protein [Halocalculus aciditolerans]|uniref:DNA polymerase sliding clamp n=1 Tax=Halocalculus aciditolerans TaxID=1383812 RepID=A0A830FI92_9EURY|nr:hypothetical protein [Halocalculus aciditolerans]GGL57783.1 DNA polymerase III sliding clamp [Halocalculus aciditolerans]